MNFIGIDPGVSGAIALWDADDQTLSIEDMPTFTITRGKKSVRIVNTIELWRILDRYRDSDTKLCMIEQTQAQHGSDQKRGYAQLMDFGFNVGIAYAALKITLAPTEQVVSSIWKRSMQVTAVKDSSRHKASQLMPMFSHFWRLAKDHNRAEAALIARYAERIHMQRMAVKS